jgi:hypothetical protein
MGGVPQYFLSAGNLSQRDQRRKAIASVQLGMLALTAEDLIQCQVARLTTRQVSI